MSQPESTSKEGKAIWICQSFRVNKLIGILIIALSLGLLAVDLVLLHRYDIQKLALRARTRSYAPRPGDTIASLTGMTINRTPLIVSFTGGTSYAILFLFSPECSLCETSWPIWDIIAHNLNSQKYQLAYANISNNSMTSIHMQKHNLPNKAKVFAKVDPKDIAAYDLGLSPAILFINPSGQVEKVWLGRIKQEEGIEIEKLLSLPSSLLVNLVNVSN